MWNILLKSIITVLVIYAVIDIAKNIVLYFISRKMGSADNVFIAIKVKNHQEHLERIIRKIIWQYLNLNNGGFIPSILIVDQGSTDDTPNIALRLCDDYSFIYYTTQEEYEKLKGDCEIK